MNKLYSLAIPIPLPLDTPKKSKRVCIHHKQDGTVLRLHIKTSLYQHLTDSQKLLGDASGLTFSQTILMRAALDQYLKAVKRMGSEELKREAYLLKELFK